MNKKVSVIAATLLLAGCSPELKIESNTEWSGAIGNSSYDGHGNATFKIDPGDCWAIQKQTQGGSLRAYAVSKTLLIPTRSGDARTTAAYGVVTGCAE